ncbi:flavoprotein [Pseudonocardia sp. CNS-139]|nr:flavoprotein [Pseudonocardia sp. CNS-139]
MTSPGVLGLVACATGGVGTLRQGLVEPALRRGWTVAVTLTPTAGRWLADGGERDRIERLTGLPVRDTPRMPGEPRPHPELTCCVVAPASASTVAKLALGISDNQALGTANEAIGDPLVPVVVFPRVSAAHVRHPAWAGHVDALRAGGVHLVYGDSVWPLDEPRHGPAGGRPLPWDAVLAAVERAVRPARSPAPGG